MILMLSKAIFNSNYSIRKCLCFQVWSMSVCMLIIFIFMCWMVCFKQQEIQTSEARSRSAPLWLTLISPLPGGGNVWLTLQQRSDLIRHIQLNRVSCWFVFLNVLSILQLYPSGDLSSLMSWCYMCQIDIQVFLQFPIIIRDDATSRFKRTAQEKYIFIFK